MSTESICKIQMNFAFILVVLVLYCKYLGVMEVINESWKSFGSAYAWNYMQDCR